MAKRQDAVDDSDGPRKGNALNAGSLGEKHGNAIEWVIFCLTQLYPSMLLRLLPCLESFLGAHDFANL